MSEKKAKGGELAKDTRPDYEVVESQGNDVQRLIAQGIQSGASIEMMERLFQLSKDVKTEQAREHFTKAMAKFQADCPVIKKTKPVHDKYGKLRYHYAPLDSIVLQVKEALGANDLAYDFSEERSEDGKRVTVTCNVTHALGHTKSSNFTVEVGEEAYMTDSQKYASRNTFAKRYAFCNVLGIATGDEDTDAKEEEKEQIKAPASPKAKIMSLLKNLDVDTTDGEVIKAEIKKLTQLEAEEENFEEIIERLSVLVSEKNENA